MESKQQESCFTKAEEIVDTNIDFFPKQLSVGKVNTQETLLKTESLHPTIYNFTLTKQNHCT